MVTFLSLVQLGVIAGVIAAGVGGPVQQVSNDLAARLATIQKSIASGRSLTDVQLSDVAAGIGDADGRTRFLAISVLSQARMAAWRATADPRDKDRLRGHPALTAAVSAALQDPDYRIRGAAVASFEYVTVPTADLYHRRLMSVYSSEQHDDVRGLILRRLGQHLTDRPDVQSLLVQGLTDPTPTVRRAAALGIARFRPPDALGTLAEELARSSETREEVLYALASYGNAAKPHLPLLATLLASEQRAERKRQLQVAIKTISEGR